MTDITKMLRQIKIHDDDLPLQLVIWQDSVENETIHQLTAVTYGTHSAPFLASRVLMQLIKDECYNSSLAVDLLTLGRHVDDICDGSDSRNSLLNIAK